MRHPYLTLKKALLITHYHHICIINTVSTFISKYHGHCQFWDIMTALYRIFQKFSVNSRQIYIFFK